jgi:hypothetical protein
MDEIRGMSFALPSPTTLLAFGPWRAANPHTKISQTRLHGLLAAFAMRMSAP